MRLAEQITFGGGGIDRAAHLRANGPELSRLWSDETTCAVPIWRGKPLCAPDGVGWMAPTHPVIEAHRENALFLGRIGGAARFAIDLSAWEPPEMPATLGAFQDPSEQQHPDLPDTHVFAELRRRMTLLPPADAELAATARALLGWHRSHRFCAACGTESAVSQAGWQRDCPACGTHHFPRTDPVVIMLITRGNCVLLGRSPGWPDGFFSLLAGYVEPGETVEAAVRREVAEEAGIRVGPVGYLTSQPWPFPASLMLGCWGRAETDEITVDPVEITEAFWMRREDLLAVFAGESTAIQPARRGAIAEFLLRNWLADRLD